MTCTKYFGWNRTFKYHAIALVKTFPHVLPILASINIYHIQDEMLTFLFILTNTNENSNNIKWDWFTTTHLGFCNWPLQLHINQKGHNDEWVVKPMLFHPFSCKGCSIVKPSCFDD
jgi:hypothetical protein